MSCLYQRESGYIYFQMSNSEYGSVGQNMQNVCKVKNNLVRFYVTIILILRLRAETLKTCTRYYGDDVRFYI